MIQNLEHTLAKGPGRCMVSVTDSETLGYKCTILYLTTGLLVTRQVKHWNVEQNPRKCTSARIKVIAIPSILTKLEEKNKQHTLAT